MSIRKAKFRKLVIFIGNQNMLATKILRIVVSYKANVTCVQMVELCQDYLGPAGAGLAQ